MTPEDRAKAQTLAAQLLEQLRAGGPTQLEPLPDDVWRAFWARLRATTWLWVMAILTALTLLSTLTVNAFRIWDRLFGP